MNALTVSVDERVTQMKTLCVCFALACGINAVRAGNDSVVGLILECTGKKTVSCKCGWNGAVISDNITLKFLSNGYIEENCFRYTASSTILELQCKGQDFQLHVSIDRISGIYTRLDTRNDWIITGGGSCKPLQGPKF